MDYKFYLLLNKNNYIVIYNKFFHITICDLNRDLYCKLNNVKYKKNIYN